MNHPARTAIIIKNSIKHHLLNNYSKNLLQATSVLVGVSACLLISAVYLPPRYTVKQEQLKDLYNTLGCRFIAGDYNASIPTGDPDSLHPEDVKYSKRLKEITENTHLWENPHTGLLTGINYWI
jgi:hypothetical protein